MVDIVDILFWAIVMVFSLGVHEWAHAWTALKFGDDTAYMQGRVTLNPIAHIDVLGLIPILLGLPLGWAKPVPVNPYKVNNPSVGLPLIAAAGPISNLLQMVLGCLIWFMILQFDLYQSHFVSAVVLDLLKKYIVVNIVLALFNLIPVYPLDGSKVISLLLPEGKAIQYENTMQRLGYIPFVALYILNMVFNGVVFGFWFGMWSPVFNPFLSLLHFPLDLNQFF